MPDPSTATGAHNPCSPVADAIVMGPMPPTYDVPEWRTLGALPSAVLGATGGVAWAASLRGWMVQVAGDESVFDWVGTFALILLPGALVGLLLGLADYARRSGGRRGWRWLAASPLLFAVAVLLQEGAVERLLSTGIGGAGLGVALLGILGGFAVSGRGPLWLRIVLGVPAAALVVVGGVASFGFDLPVAADWEPRQAWASVLFVSLMILFVFACALPHRRVVVRSPYRRTMENGTHG
jgi:hypothetical protein